MQEWYCEDCVARIKNEEEDEEAKEVDEDVEMNDPSNELDGKVDDDINQAMRGNDQSGSEDN